MRRVFRMKRQTLYIKSLDSAVYLVDILDREMNAMPPTSPIKVKVVPFIIDC